MPARFIIGRAGTGKTRYCVDQIVRRVQEDALGRRILWLLPKQATFQAQRLLACDPRLAGYCNVRVASFDQFVDDVLLECGGLGSPDVSPLGRRMILSHLLRRHEGELRFFRSAARQPGLAAEIDAAFVQFEQAGTDLTDLAALLGDGHGAAPSRDDARSAAATDDAARGAADKATATTGEDAAAEAAAAARAEDTAAADDPADDAAPLRDKLADLQLIYRAYQSYLGGSHIDPYARQRQAGDLVGRAASLADTIVFVDEFYDLTEYERLLLTRIATGAAEINITLCLDPSHPVLSSPAAVLDEMGLFHRTARTYVRVRAALHEAGVPLVPALLLEAAPRFANPSLAVLERQMVSPGTGTLAGDGVRLIAAPGPREEVECAARQVKRHLSSGMRLRDIVVLVRSIEDYHDLLEAGFRAHDIPFFVDRRRTAGHHPLIRLLRSVMQIALQHWPIDATVALVKSGLAGVSDGDADLLEDYLLQHRITPAGWTSDVRWNFRRELHSDESDDPAVTLFTAGDLEVVDVVRTRLRDALSPVTRSPWARDALPVRERVVALFEVMNALGTSAELGKRLRQPPAAGPTEMQEEDLQVWENLVDLFDQLSDLLGDEAVSAGEFGQLLETGLETFDLAIVPPTVDQVLIGVIGRTRTPPVRAAIVMGLNTGQFPLAHREESVLSDHDRRLLGAGGVRLDADSERRQLDEQFLGYIALTRGSERLTLTRPATLADGSAGSPSPFWLAVERLFPSARPEVVASCDSIATPRQLLTHLMRWARDPQAADAPAAVAAGQSDPREQTSLSLYDRLARGSHDNPELADLVARVWPALAYDNQPVLPAELAGQLFRSPLRASVSRLEAFASCPFQHFARYGLALKTRPEQEVTSLDLGSIYHLILDRLIARLVDQRISFIEPHAVSPEDIGRLAQEIAQVLRDQIMLSSARNRYLLQRIEQTLELAVAAQQEVARSSALRPRRTELAYGLPDAPLSAVRIPTPGGREVLLRGKIDRVDIADAGRAMSVIDYKLTARPLRLDKVLFGLSLQLITYLVALQDKADEIDAAGYSPAAAFYVGLRRTIENVPDPAVAPEPGSREFNLKTKPRGVIDRRSLPVLDSMFANGATGQSAVVVAGINKGDNQLTASKPDALESEDFALLLASVRRTLGQLGDEICTGTITPLPYLIGRKESACTYCDYRSVCRFDLSTNRYHTLQPLDRTEVLATLRAEDGSS